MKLLTHTSTSGALPWRIGPNGTVEVGLVHRTKRGDWSIPKGGADRGERALACSKRELFEETGLVALLEHELPTIRYFDRKRREKTVRYWAAEVVAGSFSPNEEIADFRWETPVAAIKLLTHARERAIVLALANYLDNQGHNTYEGRQNATLIIRGAAALEAEEWEESDASRPLTDVGIEISRALPMIAATFGITQVLSATTRRSIETVKPLASRFKLDVNVTSLLDEGQPCGHKRVIDAVRGLGAALCMHEASIRELLVNLKEREGTKLDPRFRTRRGSVWALFGDDHGYRNAVYIPMPDPDLIATYSRRCKRDLERILTVACSA